MVTTLQAATALEGAVMLASMVKIAGDKVHAVVKCVAAFLLLSAGSGAAGALCVDRGTVHLSKVIRCMLAVRCACGWRRQI